MDFGLLMMPDAAAAAKRASPRHTASLTPGSPIRS